MSDPSCRTFRELLGVYVVGAIEPGERAQVDAHLIQCYECREELAGLAPLPALLNRVPLEDAERILLVGPPQEDLAEPSAQMLDSLLRRVGASKRTKRARAMFTAAAAILVAIGGTIAVTEATVPSQRDKVIEVATASKGRLAATVRYGRSDWGTQMSVRVSGLQRWTPCKFWVLTNNGRKLAGGWIVGPGGDQLWYPVRSGVREGRVTGFEITSAGRVVLEIPTP
jgi:hypothetical protein